jgi:aspartate racemase
MEDPAGKWRRVIGILGGLGPHAHVEFERRLLARTEVSLGRPAQDQDYPPWLLSSVPATPDRTRALAGQGESPLPLLERAARRLVGPGAGGADFVVMPCNAAHAFLPALRQRVGLPFVDMIAETVAAAQRVAGGPVVLGLLATDGTLDAGLYQRCAAGTGITRWITPRDLADGARLQEALVMEPVFGPLAGGRRQGGGIKSGAYLDPVRGPALRARLTDAVARLHGAGADIVVLACTEIPLSLGRDRLDGVPLIDPLEIAADVALGIASGAQDLPA